MRSLVMDAVNKLLKLSPDEMTNFFARFSLPPQIVTSVLSSKLKSFIPVYGSRAHRYCYTLVSNAGSVCLSCGLPLSGAHAFACCYCYQFFCDSCFGKISCKAYDPMNVVEPIDEKMIFLFVRAKYRFVNFLSEYSYKFNVLLGWGRTEWETLY